MENVLFEFYRGDTYQRDFTLSGWSLPISQVYFTVKENVDDKRFVMRKTLNDGITFVDETDEAKTFNLTIKSIDTDQMKTDYDYVFDIEIHSEMPDGIYKRTLATGILRLNASATRFCNEVVK